jgi:hypothetical protein
VEITSGFTDSQSHSALVGLVFVNEVTKGRDFVLTVQERDKVSAGKTPWEE